MPCRHCSILILDSEISPRVVRLQALLEERGAETLIARDCATALARCQQFDFTAALVNTEHRALAGRLEVPVLLYVGSEAPEAVVDGLEGLLVAPRHPSLPGRKV